MSKIELCEVCGSDDVDDYGCVDCFMHAALASWDDEDWEDEE